MRPLPRKYGDRLHWLKLRAYYAYLLRDHDRVISDMKRVAEYGRGQKSVSYILENIEIERSPEGEGKYRLTWDAFDFDT